ncbi:MAG: oligosaccharide flippase family protein [Proteobacteria bacterium]|nr:oligosaccharide flippase family protein [Pseudomonadota bacterium]
MPSTPEGDLGAGEVLLPDDAAMKPEPAPAAGVAGIRGSVSQRLAVLMSMRRSKTGQTIVRASSWSAASYAFSTVLRFVSRVTLAKFLSNSAPMGDVTIITVILSGLELLCDLGIGVGIVQHKQGEDEAYLGTAFSVQVLRGIILCVLAAALAVPVGWVYHDAALAPLLAFSGLSILFRSLANPGMWLLTRRVDLQRPAILTMVTEIVGFLVTVGWAIVAPSAWAIVGGTVATTAALCVGSYFIARPVRFAWDKAMARDIIHFGGWMLLSSATFFLSSRGENLILKGAVPDVQFGCFAFASMIVSTPVSAIAQLAGQVFFPVLAASLRDDRERAARQYGRSKWAFSAIAVCFAWGAIFVAPPLVALFKLPTGFGDLSWMVPLLGVRAALDIVAAPTSYVLIASGGSRFASMANVVRLIALVAGLLFTVHQWGLPGAIVALVAAPALSYLVFLPGLKRGVPGAVRPEVMSLGVFWIGVLIALIIRFAILR